MSAYSDFLATKARWGDGVGFEPVWMPDFLFDFQSYLADWSIRQGRCALLIDCGMGKAEPIGEPVLTPTGWRPIGHLKVGDGIFAGDGTVTRVVAVHPQGIRPTSTVRFSDGAEVRCDRDHLWAVRSDNHHKRGEPWKVLSTTELDAGPLRYARRDDVGTFNWRIPICNPVCFQRQPLPVDPYVLGVLLGDGCLTQGSITFTPGDSEIADLVARRLPVGLHLTEHRKEGHPKSTGYRISCGQRGMPNAMLDAVRSLGLHGKHSYEKWVPPEYMISSPHDRLDLLRGLLDTDGESSRSYVQFSTTSPYLASAVTDIVRSLGGTASTKTKIPKYSYLGEIRTGRLAYMIQIRLPINTQPFLLTRKADKYAARPRLNPVRKIVEIIEGRPERCVCITIAHSSQLYITRDYVVTHNSPLALTWAENVRRHTNKPVILATPLGVTFQMSDQAVKFGVEASISRDGKKRDGVTITNYEQLEKFDPDDFGGMVCDESSAIKNFDGKRRSIVTEFMRRLPYRLLDTATAAPNDYIELGTSSEALGYLGHMDMLSRFFTNKDKAIALRGGRWERSGRLTRNGAVHHAWEKTGWRFKGHAEESFWRWVASWARAGRKPSDFGDFDDSGFALPPLNKHYHVIKAARPKEGTLFDIPSQGLSEEREADRRTLTERCEKAAELLADADRATMWCQLNDEGKLLAKLIKGAVEVSGADSVDSKEEKLSAFSRGEIRVLVTKPKIGAFGLDWSHCHRMVYFPSNSFEQEYQAVRRHWRFGQLEPVTADYITTESGSARLANLQRKSVQADRMFDALTLHMRNALAVDHRVVYDQEVRLPTWATF